jgi:hypothetical protein
MEEPSVLDYVKSKLRFWESKKVDLALEDDLQKEVQTPKPALTRIPWRPILALVLALAGQRSFEPPTRAWQVGVFFYLISAALVIWSILRKEWLIAPIQEAESHKDPMSFRLPEMLLGGIFALFAFVFFKGNLFTSLNLALWVLAIYFLFRAFWLKDPSQKPLWTQIKDFFKQAGWQVNISWWNIIVVAAIVLVIFFRTYQLNEVPAEPISDHAEKIMDVYDITQGMYSIYFPRNTGRELIQMYLTVFVASLFGSGLSFLSLKIGTVLCGLLTLPYLYLLGKEVGNRRVGLLAVLLAGMAYWPNVISRFGLRFPLYPLFVAPVMYYLVKGLHHSTRNDFILAGLFLGLGLNGYSPFRIMPILVVFAVGLYLIHRISKGNRRQAIVWLGLMTMTSVFIFLPLLRYWLDNPDIFASRAFSRIGSIEQPLPGVWWQILLSNTWNALRMVNWSNGEIWPHSIPYRPALDQVSAALFLLGVLLLFVRYLRQRNWLDMFLLLSIPFLMLPSILSLAFPGENPSLNRTAGAYVPVFIVVAIALEGLLAGISSVMGRKRGTYINLGLTGILLVLSISQNYDLVFNQYNKQFRTSAWNSSEMGQVIKEFGLVYGSTDNAWVIGYPYWVDGRLVGMWAGVPNREFGIPLENLADTQKIPGAKLFVFYTADANASRTLKSLYPLGSEIRYPSKTPDHDFIIYFVPAQ